jgi:hypothetical protein
MAITSEQEKKEVTKVNAAFWAIIVFVLIWVIFGFSAFIMSLVCFGYSGTFGHHVIGLLLSIFTGPFYWIYFLANKSYCGKNAK